ncbi:Daunorubicin/doxorubicin resistance ABC transporter permease protein DrrB [Baekduia alba]|uniref:ABC transporter permease n=1 Tax=Baekduia alba TaxID=2997333 RepID=UPI0023417770|nr:ABC transporter permease [Baekduia alba]WCB92889.1 Daunorubicin/doxorubicin resistance ABC transporter permease protein DrrB [Baekduia alba]
MTRAERSQAGRMVAKLKWAVADGFTVAQRNLTHVRYVPEKLLDVTVQPLMFVLLFAYIFGGAIAIPGGGDYKEFLMAGIFAQTMAFTFIGAATSMAEDLHTGVVDRFRALPMARSAVLSGRVLADFASALIGLVVLVGSGLIVGWGIHTDVWHAAAGFGVLMLFTLAMLWFGTLVGMLVRAPDAAQGLGLVVLFPLTFLANSYVPTQGMDKFVRTLADYNPLSSVVAALRDLFGNPSAVGADTPWPLHHPAVSAIAWSLAILAVTVPLAIRRYQRATAG